MKNNFLSTLLLSFFTLFALPALSESINVELISYEDKKDFTGKDTCELEFTYTNNSWGTIYDLGIDTESYDDRDSKLEANIINASSISAALIPDKRERPPELMLIIDCPIMAQPPIAPKNPQVTLAAPWPIHSLFE